VFYFKAQKLGTKFPALPHAQTFESKMRRNPNRFFKNIPPQKNTEVEKSGEIGLEGIQGYSNKNCIFLG
jgi:hypothetical protein